MKSLIAVPLLCALSLAPGSVLAQGGMVRVTVGDGESGVPLTGAQVRLQGLGVGGVTDEAGVLTIGSVAPGPRTVEVRLLGYAPAAASAMVAAERTTDVRFELTRAPIALEPVRVVSRPGLLAQHGFFRRREGGLGTFLTRADIEKIRPRTLSDVLRRQPGFVMIPTVTGASPSARGTRRSCPIQYYLDGIQVAMFNVDDIPPGDVEGMEIYRGAASIPPAFKQGTALCGVILIWTRIE